jgi:hypothetical protein
MLVMVPVAIGLQLVVVVLLVMLLQVMMLDRGRLLLLGLVGGALQLVV